MMLYLLFWVLPGIVAWYILSYIMEKRITINDIVMGSILGTMMGLIAVILVIIAACAEYGDIVVIPFKRR